MTYQFPETKFTRNGIWRQYFHLLSEVLEVGLALLKRDKSHAIMEIWDVKHSCETMHRILDSKGQIVYMCKGDVIDNNCRRGYYK